MRWVLMPDRHPVKRLLQLLKERQYQTASATKLTELVKKGASGLTALRHTDLADMPSAVNTDHDSRYCLPVGFVFISVVSTNPATLLGYGTWAAFGAGRVLVGLDGGDSDFDTPEETGGAKTVASSAQTFAGDALATHNHAIGTNVAVEDHAANTTGDASAAIIPAGTVPNLAAGKTHTHSTPALTHTVVNNAGICDQVSAGTPSGTNTPGAATSVVQPYIVVYMWKRTV